MVSSFLILINFDQVAYVLRLVLQSDNDADLRMKSGSLGLYVPFSQVQLN